MKQLEIKTNKRLLVLEPNKIEQVEALKTIYKEYGEFICKGSDLTEDIAEGLIHKSIHTGLFAHYVKNIPVNLYCHKTALEAFGYAIMAYGYHWGENPVSLERENVYREMGDTFKADGILRVWKEAESRTFNPEKCIIFEIL